MHFVGFAIEKRYVGDLKLPENTYCFDFIASR